MNQTVKEESWVDTILPSLSLQEKIGQLLVPCLTADTAKPYSVPEMVAKFGIGGGYVFSGTIKSHQQFIASAQAAVDIPLLISGDLDKGAGDRVKELTFFPYQMALGAADDDELAYALGRAIAVEGRAVGYNWTFSPIVDLCAIKDHLRHIAAIGSDPKQVARLAIAQIRGLQENGMAACAKHFPGDGFDDRDQHLTTSINPLSKDNWYNLSGYPFRKAIDAGVYSIMNSCIACPGLDPEAGDPLLPRPAVISKPLIRDVLRGELGFEGVLITDALNMGGLAAHAPVPERYALALEAGNDMLLFVQRLDESVDCLVRCVETGRIPEKQIDESVMRVLLMKEKLGLHTNTKQEKIKGPRFIEDARALAEKSITLLSDKKARTPVKLKPKAGVANVLITNRQEEFTAEVFNRTLIQQGFSVTPFINPEPEDIYNQVASGEFDLVITSLFFPIQWGWVTPRCHGPYIRTIMSGYYKAHPDTIPVFISFGSPFYLYELAFMDPFLVTYGGCAASQEAAAKALLGQIPITGTCPVELPGFFKKGDGIRRAALTGIKAP